MAHGITSTDTPIYAKTAAWHGLGTVLEQAPTVDAALQLAGLDWNVEQWALSATDGENRQSVATHVLNVRSDNKAQLAVAGIGYKPIQNRELVEFAHAIAKETDVLRVESAGSLWGGARVWMLIQGQSFSAWKDRDEVRPYLLLANAHDTSMTFRGLPTSIRVECNNKLRMALSVGKSCGVSIRHTGEMAEKIEEARDVLRTYDNTAKDFREAVQTLARKDITSEQIRAFWLEVYQCDFDKIPANPTTDKERKQRDAAKLAMSHMGARFDRERDIAGPTAWNALNSYTQWLQHVRPVRAADEAKRRETRTDNALFGKDADRSTHALIKALALV